MKICLRLNWIALILGVYMGWFRQIPEDARLSRALQDLSSLSHSELLVASDPWGSKYQYSIISAADKRCDNFYSLGPNKTSINGGNDIDDVSIYTKKGNWIENSYHVSYYRYGAFIAMGVGLAFFLPLPGRKMPTSKIF